MVPRAPQLVVLARRHADYLVLAGSSGNNVWVGVSVKGKTHFLLAALLLDASGGAANNGGDTREVSSYVKISYMFRGTLFSACGLGTWGLPIS